MPRSEAEQPEVKPFEFRVGVALPVFGGMYRAGDPATIPPNKFHLLVNVRISPSGMASRPGMALEYDTGVQECIDGITGLDEPGGTVLLWPGAVEAPGNSDPARNGATFREIRSFASDNESEFKTVVLEAPNEVSGNQTAVLQPPLRTYGASTPGEDNLPACEPFFFRGELCAFDFARPNGALDFSLPYRILKLTMPKASGLSANNCRRTTAWEAPPCPPTPDFSGGPNWPRGEPIGAVLTITNLPEEYPVDDWQIETFIVLTERDDDPLTAEVGIHEFLYVLLKGRNGGAQDGERRLLKYSGTTWTLEFTPPDDLLHEVAIGPGKYGPFLVASSIASNWSAYRGPAGTWVTEAGITPAGWATEPGNAFPQRMWKRGFQWNGQPAVLIGNENFTFGGCGGSVKDGVWVVAQTPAGGFKTVLFPVAVYTTATEQPRQILGMGLARGRVFALIRNVGTTEVVAASANGEVACTFDERQLSDASHDAPWMADVGGQILVGGRILNFDPVGQVTGESRHGVYDATQLDQGLLRTYEVLDSEQPLDEQTERYSYGALPAYPQQLEGVD